jgi:hypothetical protein
MEEKVYITKIVSGGQTGADQAALDYAIANNIPHGGWCPEGRKAEDGPLDPRYALAETPRADYLQRTEWTVRDTDGTVIFTVAAKLTGGSKRTAEFAARHSKPVIHLSQEADGAAAAARLTAFVRDCGTKVPNGLASRASKEPEVGRLVCDSLAAAFCKQKL